MSSCVECGSSDTVVLETRRCSLGKWRKRKCRECGSITKTLQEPRKPEEITFVPARELGVVYRGKPAPPPDPHKPVKLEVYVPRWMSKWLTENNKNESVVTSVCQTFKLTPP